MNHYFFPGVGLVSMIMDQIKSSNTTYPNPPNLLQHLKK